jgi:SAM-dependent methyltransferase
MVRSSPRRFAARIERLDARAVYVLASGTLARETDTLDQVRAVLGNRSAGDVDAGPATTVREGRLGQLPFRDASFDALTAATVLCFVPAAAGALRDMARTRRRGGHLVLGELGPRPNPPGLARDP